MILEHTEREETEPALVDEETNPARPRRDRQPPQRLNDFLVFPDSAITNAGDLMQSAFMAESESMTVEEALEKPHWK